MRPSLSLKTLLRAPFMTLMTFLLIVAASFAVFYRVADYAITQREMERATDYYRGVAALDNGVPNTAMLLASSLPNTRKYSYYKEEQKPINPLTAEQMRTFSELPGVSSTDTRYMTAGIIHNLKRIVRSGSYAVNYDYTERFVIEGTFSGYTSEKYGFSNMNRMNITDCRQLAGELPLKEGDSVPVNTFPMDGETSVLTRGDMRVFFTLYDNPFGQSFIDELTVGDRYLIVGRWNAEFFDDKSLFIGDQDTIDYCDAVWQLTGKSENYLETKEFARVKDIVDITNRDFKTFDIVYTSDMLSIPRFNERKMVIQEGRALTEADTNSCVMNLTLMELNGLKTGDKITVDLCDRLFYQRDGLGALAVIPERYGMPATTVELEIVGAYLDTDAQHERNASAWWCYSPNTIFVPSSLLPVEVPADYEIRPGEFSVIIDDAFMMDEFLNEAKPLAKDMGIELRFSDSGWLKVENSVGTNQKMSLITTVLYLGAAAIALLLAVYLYIGRSKRSYGIMRALGTPKNKANDTLLMPLFVLSAFAIVTGSIVGMVYASKTIVSALGSLSDASEQYIPNTSLPVWTMLICLFCEVVFLAAVFSLFIRNLANTPPLVLLQRYAVRIKDKKEEAGKQITEETALPGFIPSFSISLDLPEKRDYSGARHVVRYIQIHMRRSGWKTALVILLTVLLAGAIGLFAVTKLSYQNLFDKTEVIGTLNNYPSNSVMESEKSELMKDFYYSGGFFVICNGIPAESGELLALTNDIDRYVQIKSLEEYSIEYAEGYDASLFSENKPHCLIGSVIADIFGLKPGDDIKMLSWDRHYVMSSIHEGDEFITQLEKSSLAFKVSGVITSEDFGISKGIFAPLSEEVEQISEYGIYPFPVELAEYKLVNKENPYELRDYLDGLTKYDRKYQDSVSYNLDTTEIDNVKRVRDMLTLLFPIAAAVAVLIGLTASGLIVMQSAKEAAILRVLGTTKLRVRCMRALEQISLCLFGLILVALGLVIYNTDLFIQSRYTLLFCGGLYLLGCTLSVVFMSIKISHRRLLELLQVKE